MNEQQIYDDEFVLRHIPGGTTWQAPGPRITSKNFELRAGETGISVSRQSVTTAGELMARLGNPSAGSRVAVASVAAIRALGLEVVAVPMDDDAGHAEICAGRTELKSQPVRKQLAQLFVLLPARSPS